MRTYEVKLVTSYEHNAVVSLDQQITAG